MIKKGIKILFKGYKAVIGPIFHQVLGGFTFGCRYYPTCSEYLKESVEAHGIKGFFYGAKRVLRCHPFSRGGFDPIIK